jgi:hypothetical protein
MRVPFGKIFHSVDDRVIPLTNVLIGEIAIAAGVPMASILKVSGTELRNLTNCDLDYRIEDGLTVIVGFHPAEMAPSSNYQLSQAA